MTWLELPQALIDDTQLLDCDILFLWLGLIPFKVYSSGWLWRPCQNSCPSLFSSRRRVDMCMCVVALRKDLSVEIEDLRSGLRQESPVRAEVSKESRGVESGKLHYLGSR